MSSPKVMRKHLVLMEITVHHHKGMTDKTAVWAAQQLVKEGMKAGSFRGSLAGQATVKATVKSYKRHISYLKSQQDKSSGT